jgi:hypothetical protein
VDASGGDVGGGDAHDVVGRGEAALEARGRGQHESGFLGAEQRAYAAEALEIAGTEPA